MMEDNKFKGLAIVVMVLFALGEVSAGSSQVTYAVHSNSSIIDRVINWMFRIWDESPSRQPNMDYLPLGDGYSSTHNISTCSNLNEPGATYKLTADIIDSSTSYCMNISVNNITLDCQEYLIDGDDSAIYGIYVYRATNITIRNCMVSDWNRGIALISSSTNHLTNIWSSSNNYGIHLMSSDNNNLTDITTNSNTYGMYFSPADNNNLTDIVSNSNAFGIFISSSSNNHLTNITTNSNTWYGISLGGCSDNYLTDITSDSNYCGIHIFNSYNNTLHSSRIRGNTNYGIYVESIASGKVENNKIYNNLFKNSNNFGFSGPIYANQWNTTKQSGIRIYSLGVEISGNYWTNPLENGYSDTCDDTDHDGFCDQNYTLNSQNIDYLPLSDEYPVEDTTPPVITIINPPNGTSLPAGTTWTWINISTDENATCRYNLTNPAFDYTTEGVDFTNTGGLEHSFNYSGLLNGKTYTLYHKCMNNFGNINTNSMMHKFSVLPTPPLLQLWNRTYSSDWNLLTDLVIDGNDNIIVTGWGLFSGAYTIKYDSEGVFVWGKEVSDGGISAVAVDSSNNVILGTSTSDLYVVKYLPNGTIVWNRTYDSGLYETVSSVACDRDDNIVVFGEGDASPQEWEVVKYYKDGNQLWNKTFNSLVGKNIFSQAVTVDSNDNIILAGYGGYNSSSIDFIIMKYYPNGSMFWNEPVVYHSESGNRYARAVSVDKDDNILVAGERNGHLYVQKYDPNGNFIWDAEESGITSEAYAMAIDKKDRILVGGTRGEHGSKENYIACYDTSGNKLWDFSNDPTEFNDWIYGMAVDSHNDIGVGSSTSDFYYLTEKYGYSRISIGDAEAESGQEITIPIKLYNSPGVAAVGVKLSYNASVVNVTNATQGNFTSFFGFDNTNANNGWVTINTYITGQDLIGDLVVANVTLEAVGSSGSSPLNLEILTLSDQYGNEVFADINNGVFKITPLEYIKEIHTGWNLISTPVKPENTSIEAVVGNMAGRIVVTAYNTTTDEWHMYDSNSSETSTLDEIVSGRGYWLYSEYEQNLSIHGYGTTEGVDLYAGWNLIGYNSLTSENMSTALSSLNGSITVYTYNTSNDNWDIYNYGGLWFLNTFTEMTPGRGYWLRSDGTQTWKI